jgi:formate dehydrogenase maturation protein FdhE
MSYYYETINQRLVNNDYKIEHAYIGIEKCNERIDRLEQSRNHTSENTKKIVERIEKLEKSFDMELAQKLIYEGVLTHASILKLQKNIEELEKWKESAIEKNIQYVKRIKELERFQEITHAQYKNIIKKTHPHKCPVCHGIGKRENILLPEQIENPKRFIECNACEGKGIVWG